MFFGGDPKRLPETVDVRVYLPFGRFLMEKLILRSPALRTIRLQ